MAKKTSAQDKEAKRKAAAGAAAGHLAKKARIDDDMADLFGDDDDGDLLGDGAAVDDSSNKADDLKAKAKARAAKKAATEKVSCKICMETISWNRHLVCLPDGENAKPCKRSLA